jgi:hypothetical protein
MNQRELLGQASGLKRTAENRIKAGQANQPAESIVRQAAQILIQSADRLNGGDPAFRECDVYPGMTWLEILAVAKAVCNFSNQSVRGTQEAALHRRHG